jgi:hypothetical protein
MNTVPLDARLLAELFGCRDALVRAIQAGAATGQWEPVMPAFDAMLAVIVELEQAVRTAGSSGAPPE